MSSSLDTTPNAVKSITYDPVFTIRGVTHREMFDSYSSGNFSEISLGRTLVQLEDNPIEDTDVKHLKTKKNHTMTIIMAEKTPCYDENGQPIEPGRCDWCRDIILGTPFGVPVRSKYDPTTKKTMYTCIGKVGHFECAKGLLSRYGNTGIFLNSSQLLNALFELNYPGETLGEVTDFKLHENWGGRLSSEEFHSHKYVYRPTDSCCIQYASLQYIRELSPSESTLC